MSRADAEAVERLDVQVGQPVDGDPRPRRAPAADDRADEFERAARHGRPREPLAEDLACCRHHRTSGRNAAATLRSLAAHRPRWRRTLRMPGEWAANTARPALITRTPIS